MTSIPRRQAAQLILATSFGFIPGIGTAARRNGGVPPVDVDVMHSFAPGGQPHLGGMGPRAGLAMATDGSLYGTALEGGRGAGTIYQISGGRRLRTVHAFSPDGAKGAYPACQLVQASDGALWGTATRGGAFGWGVVFRFRPDAVLEVMHSFSIEDGRDANAGLVQASNGVLYGLTASAGDFSQGTAYRISLDGAFETLHSFQHNVDGAFPQYPLVEGRDGWLYGTTIGPDGGTIFRMSLDGTVDVVRSMAGRDGRGPQGLIQAADDWFYGTTSIGGPDDRGNIYRVHSNGQLEVLHEFRRTTPQEGANPKGLLLQASNGKLYGTCADTSSFEHDTLFSITTEGGFKLLHSFEPRSGPNGDLVEVNHVLVGTTQGAGEYGHGTVYRARRHNS